MVGRLDGLSVINSSMGEKLHFHAPIRELVYSKIYRIVKSSSNCKHVCNIVDVEVATKELSNLFVYLCHVTIFSLFFALTVRKSCPCFATSDV